MTWRSGWTRFLLPEKRDDLLPVAVSGRQVVSLLIIVLHNGDKPGFSSSFTRFLNERLSVIVLCNSSSGGPAFALSLGVADLFLK